ncbi:MAG: hydrogenase maturation nickel metallochaperone HypA [Schwartzia sp.]|nr:hydrogenase maturation nickel metallochaperone HypA [Schwartzia sp. (in: firmicutes)]
MHEMAIAEGILDIAKEQAAKEKSARILKIGLLIGEMAGVEEDALRFCFSALTRGTLAENAELSIVRVPLVGRCGSCDFEKPVENYNFICPKCGGGLAVVSGRELRVEYLEME